MKAYHPPVAAGLPRTCLSTLLITVLTCFFSPLIVEIKSEPAPDYLDVTGLQAKDDLWNVQRTEGDGTAGVISLENRKWLMYFLHWRPLTDSMEVLTPDYVEHHLLNFWGESMPFELGAGAGETTVNGHPARFLEATIYDSAIATRFVVWNCEQSGRQFTADCNINLRVGTPAKYLETQKQMTQTLQCHGDQPAEPTEALPLIFHDPAWQLSFAHPNEWTCNRFNNPEWYPDSLSATNGSLWTLMRGATKKIALYWKPTEGTAMVEQLKAQLSELPHTPSLLADTTVSMAVETDTTFTEGMIAWSKGQLIYTQTHLGEVYKTPYYYRAAGWESDGRSFCLVTALSTMDEMWGIPVDLSPPDDLFRLYLEEQVIPFVREFPKSELPAIW